jgi:hypothetical protein
MALLVLSPWSASSSPPRRKVYAVYVLSPAGRRTGAARWLETEAGPEPETETEAGPAAEAEAETEVGAEAGLAVEVEVVVVPGGAPRCSRSASPAWAP